MPCVFTGSEVSAKSADKALSNRWTILCHHDGGYRGGGLWGGGTAGIAEHRLLGLLGLAMFRGLALRNAYCYRMVLDGGRADASVAE